MFAAWWAILVANTVFESHLKLAGGYFVLFYFAGIAFATWVSLLELFALPEKAEAQESDTSRRPSVSQIDQGLDAEETDADERTGLLNRGRPTFARYNEEDTGGDRTATADKGGTRKKEEPSWSRSLPTWTWLLQFLLVAPIAIILIDC
jgi:hypothetical protein